MLTSTGQFYFLTLAVDHNLNHCNFKDWVWLIQVDSDNSKHHTPSIQSVRNAQSASVFFRKWTNNRFDSYNCQI